MFIYILLFSASSLQKCDSRATFCPRIVLFAHSNDLIGPYVFVRAMTLNYSLVGKMKFETNIFPSDLIIWKQTKLINNPRKIKFIVSKGHDFMKFLSDLTPTRFLNNESLSLAVTH